MEQIILTTKAEYDFVNRRGYQPLLPNRYFKVDIKLRKELQERYFGSRGKDIRKVDAKFFRWIWQNKPHFCEECGKPLQYYSATFCSHIMTRGGNPEMANDPRNINILCLEHHNQWENGNRKAMRIYERNQKIIEELKSDYNIKDKEK